MTEKISLIRKGDPHREGDPINPIPAQAWSSFHQEDDTIDLKELFHTLWNWKFLILAITVFASVGSLITTEYLPKTYTTSVIFDYGGWKNLSIALRNPIILDGIVRRNQLTGVILPDATNANGSKNQFSPEEMAVQMLMEKETLKIELNDHSIPELIVQNHNPQNASKLANLLPEQLRFQHRLFQIEKMENQRIDLIKEKKIIQDAVIPIENKVEKMISEFPELLLFFRNVEQDEVSELESVLGEKLSNLSMAKQNPERDSTGLAEEVEELRDMIGQVALVKGELFLKKMSFDHLWAKLNELNNQLKSIDDRIFQIYKDTLLDDSSSLILLTHSIPPDSPTKPKVRLIIALSTVVGFFFAIFLCFSIEFFRNLRHRE